MSWMPSVIWWVAFFRLCARTLVLFGFIAVTGLRSGFDAGAEGQWSCTKTVCFKKLPYSCGRRCLVDEMPFSCPLSSSSSSPWLAFLILMILLKGKIHFRCVSGTFEGHSQFLTLSVDMQEHKLLCDMFTSVGAREMYYYAGAAVQHTLDFPETRFTINLMK